jgi:fucose 4-O-acetylase-like acetyltransferase
LGQHGGRLDWIDAARGIGIILVVYGHAIRGLLNAHLYPPSPALIAQDSLIYSFHMPLFFFVSGLFAGRIGDRNKWFRSRIATIVWPYFLWSIAQSLINMAAGSMVNSRVEWGELLSILWDPIAQFWFLYALFLCQLLLLLPRPVFYALALISVVATGLFHGIIGLTIRDLPFFAAGVWLTAMRADQASETRRAAVGITIVAWALFAAALSIRPLLVGPADSIARVVIGLAGTVGTLGVARLIAARTPPLVWLGAASMPIFLLHVIFTAGLRIVITHLHITLPQPLFLAALTLAGLIGPIVVYLIAERLGWSPALGFGRSRRAGSGPVATPAQAMP